MRRIKPILAVVVAVATMMVLAAPAIAQTFEVGGGDLEVSDANCPGFCAFDNFSGDLDDHFGDGISGFSTDGITAGATDGVISVD